jgi:hypothetical protein
MIRSSILLAVMVLLACGGSDRPPGEIEGAPRGAESLAAAARAQEAASERLAKSAGAKRQAAPKQILFGDLHAHTTYSLDAFAWSLPLVGGEGAHPPADACDFARHCSALDFFALTDHGESLTPEHWAIEKETLRQCNARAGDPGNPDLVAFLGFEWTQVGQTPETHFGHRCVVFPGLDDDDLPARPINSRPAPIQEEWVEAGQEAAMGRWLDPLNWRFYADLAWLADRVESLPVCESGVDTRELPLDCSERAPTPDVLLEKLAQWNLEALVIPHGTTWGSYTPMGSTLDKQLRRAYYDPESQPVIELMSGHGNSEEYRGTRAIERGDGGEPVCPEPTPGYLPCCWRAGEIMRERCGDLPESECEARVEEAKRLVLEADIALERVFPDADPEEWLDCGQCRDCFKPSFGYRAGSSVQYGLALTNFDEADDQGRPLRYRYGFLASSDNHTGRPGTGYKQVDRHLQTDTVGAASGMVEGLVERIAGTGQSVEDPRRPQPVPLDAGGGPGPERVASFWYPGGLVAVHAEGRTQDAIFDALRRREVYATSGPRILLWFDLTNDPAVPQPMGSELSLGENPRFEVRAVGASVQKPGCPESAQSGLSPERIEKLCHGRCYHPGDEQHAIAAIEVVRIRPQSRPGERVDDLIEDPWRRFECDPDPAGCVVRFEDEEFAAAGRDVVYYARALQVPTPAINGDPMSTEFDAQGRATSVTICSGSYRTPVEDDCLAPVSERAWSSPIYVDYGGSGLTVSTSPGGDEEIEEGLGAE